MFLSLNGSPHVQVSTFASGRRVYLAGTSKIAGHHVPEHISSTISDYQRGFFQGSVSFFEAKSGRRDLVEGLIDSVRKVGVSANDGGETSSVPSLDEMATLERVSLHGLR